MTVDILFIIAGAICLIIGLIGSILPGLPGPPISYIGLLLLHLTEKVQFTTGQLIWWALLMLLTIIFDYLMPVLGVKKWNGSKWGNWGCIIGTIVGCFFPPWGILLGPFMGAVLGELVIGGKQTGEAIKAGFGAFIGFLVGVVFKVMVCCWFIYCFINAIF